MKRGFLLEKKGGKKASATTTNTAKTDSNINVSSTAIAPSKDQQHEGRVASTTPAIGHGHELVQSRQKPVMERGFLLDKNPPRKTGTPSASDGRVKIPGGEIIKRIDHGVLNIPKDFTTMHATHLPPPDLNKDALDIESICLLYVGMKDAILALPGFPQAPKPPIELPPQYLIKPAEGAGQGMFAARAFAPGDLILAERPALVQPHWIPMYRDQDPQQFNDIFEVLVTHMPPAQRAEFEAMHNCKPVTRDYPAVRGLIDTNALGLGHFPGWDGMMAGVCMRLARVNHSCAPNAAVRWNMRAFQEELRATREIAPGEQVCIAYIGVLPPRAERRATLERMYTFVCHCAACAVEADAARESDARRKLLAAGVDKCVPGDERELRAWVADQGMAEDAVIAPALRVLGMMREEGLLEDEMAGPQYARLVKAYCALGNEAEARKWAREAAVISTVYAGEDGGWAKVADDPRKTDWWGVRVPSS